ncbi:MAG: ATP-binding cassette domain-containing protein [Coriobacteriales bacterium]
MIEVKDIRKSYKAGDFVQNALDGVSLNLRDNEFVAILGPSGSGKTTFLNILGGLDRADSGDIVINGISTKDYKDRDWDTYRNHRIGFVFQSYNLIPHQTVLSNVELALTLSGVSRADRKERATKALERVGLGDHINKNPSQLSGGQMQRVAIARALVNNPEIVLADEPTGALDTETGIQVMDILEEVAQDRLVVMVTHNPDLADRYASRIVRLSDGKIVSDSDPYIVTAAEVEAARAMEMSAAVAVPMAAAAGEASEPTVPSVEPEAESAEAGELGQDQTGFSRVDEGAAEPGEPGTEPAEQNAEVTEPAEPGAEVATEPAPTTSVKNGAEPAAGAAAAMAAEDAADKTAAFEPVGVSSSADKGPSSKSKAGKKYASMSFLTALALSFQNLMTKKGRTFLTAFAGSIGIIGIAAILALSNGVNNYITDTEEDALTNYPLTITKSSFDITSLMSPTTTENSSDAEADSGVDTSSTIPETTIMSDMFAEVKNNDLVKFKAYLESGESDIYDYVSAIQYSYGIVPQIFEDNVDENGVVQLNPSSVTSALSNDINTSSLTSSAVAGTSVFNEMLNNQEVLEEQMDVVEGRWPESYDEAVLVLNENGGLSDYTLYCLGVYDPDNMSNMVEEALNGEEVEVPETEQTLTYDDAMNLTFRVVPSAYMYDYSSSTGTWTDKSDDDEFMKDVVENGIQLKIVGIVMPDKTSSATALSEGVAYTPELTNKLIEMAGETEIVKEQVASPDVDVFTGETFEELQDSQGDDFDLTSIFSIDEDKLAQAFSFDTSGLDFSDLNFDTSSIDTGSIDPSSISVDSSTLSSIMDEDAIRSIMQNAPEFTMPDAGGDLTDDQIAAISQTAQEMSADFASWLVSEGKIVPGTDPDYGALFSEYLQTERGASYMNQISQELSANVADQVSSALEDYMTNEFAPYLTQAMQQLMIQAANVMVTEVAQQINSEMASMTDSLGSQLNSIISGELSSKMSSLQDQLASSFNFDADTFADAITVNLTQEDLTSLLENYMNSEDLSYDSNIAKLGYADLDDPESISIYPVDFPAKEHVIEIIDDYNTKMEQAGDEDSTIQYSDIVGTLMSSITDIVNMISMVLIAFVSISLVVSSIMIGIITYISVLERKKEIGILRAMGASKRNIANVFNAETFIIGLISGVFAIIVVLIASVPVNAFVLAGWNVPNVMTLPVYEALILILISVLLTLIAGFIPAIKASRRDPVEALRGE